MSNFIIGMIRDCVPPFEVIRKQYFKVGVEHLTVCGTNGMIVGTCIRSIFNSIKLDKREVLDNLSMLNFAILSKNVIHNVFVDVVDATDEQLSYKNQLMDFGG